MATEQQLVDAYNPNQQDTTKQDAQKNIGNWGYGDTSADRQEQIVDNLNKAYQQDPSKFSDWNTFSQNFNYDYEGRSDKERETMRNWYGYQMGQQGGIDYNNVNNTDYLLSQLMNGQTLGGTGAAATSAYNRYRDYQSLSGMTPEQIASAVSNDSINPVGQSMIDLKNYSPALYAQVQGILQNQTEVDDINSVGTGIYDGLTKTTTNSNYTKYNFTDEYAKNASVIKQYNESLYKKIEGLGGDTAAYVSIVASMLQNPLIQANKDEIENIEGEIAKIQDNIWTIGDTARQVLGSEAPEDLVSAYISQQTKALQTQLRTLNNSLLVSQGKLDNQLSEVDALINAINQGLETYGTEGTGTSGSSYQYVSGSKYQEPGYFDKSTGQFYKLGETPDTHDYQSSDPARLQEIADNLVDIANSKDVYVFRDRSAFNDYFKYNKRSAAQKAVLDEFWNANAATLQGPAQQRWAQYQKEQAAKAKSSGGGSGGGGSGSGGGSSDDVSRIKKALMEGTFSGGWGVSNLKKYGYTGGGDDKTILRKIGITSTPDEIKQIVYRLPDKSLKSAIIAGYLTSHYNEIQTALDNVGRWGKESKRKEYIVNLLKSLGDSSPTEKSIKQVMESHGFTYDIQQ